MSTILVVDDEAICRELISAALRTDGYQTICAANAMQALTLLASELPDLALLDVRMPGMDGIALLETIRGAPEWKALPVILLTQVVDMAFVLRARELKAQDYLLKNRFLLEDFLARVRKHAHPSSTAHATSAAQLSPQAAPSPDAQADQAMRAARATKPERPAPTLGPGKATAEMTPVQSVRLTREETVERIRAFTQPRTLAGVVAEVIAITGSPHTSAAELAEALSRDPLLAARVLEVANSAAFAGGKGRTTTLDDAVTKMGFASIQKIAARIGIFDAFPPEGSDGFHVIRCWQHSFAVAAIMDIIAAESDGGGHSMAHLVGLCHDLGKMIMRQLFADEYAFVAQVSMSSGRPMRQVEAEVFGVARPELVSIVLSAIGLPREIVSPIHEFFAHEEGESRAQLGSLAQMLRLANSYAHGMIFATSVSALVRPFSQAECRGAGQALDAARLDARKIRTEVLTMTHLLAKLPPGDSARLSKPLVEPRAVKVWYTPHRSFVALDPLALALQFLSECAVHEQLPQRPEDLKGFRGLVVAAPRSGLSPASIPELDGLRRAAGRRDIPILCLAREDDPSAPMFADHVTFSGLPIALGELASWISRLPAEP